MSQSGFIEVSLLAGGLRRDLETCAKREIM